MDVKNLSQRLREKSIQIEAHQNKLIWFLLYYGVFFLLYKTIEASFNYTPYVSIILITAFIFFYIWVYKRLNEKKIFQWWTGLPISRYFLVFLILTSLVFFTSLLFGSITYSFYKLNFIAFNITSVELNNVSELYLWHGLDLIPTIAITETLHMKKPFLNSDSNLFCWLMLFFKTTYIYITLELVVKWLKWIKELK